jgi:hypothetical protein
MSLSDIMDFLDPECKYKCFVFTNNPKEILIRSRFRNFVSCFAFLRFENLQMVMTQPESLIYANDNEIKVSTIESAIEVINWSNKLIIPDIIDFTNDEDEDEDGEEANNIHECELKHEDKLEKPYDNIKKGIFYTGMVILSGIAGAYFMKNYCSKK